MATSPTIPAGGSRVTPGPGTVMAAGGAPVSSIVAEGNSRWGIGDGEANP